MDSMEVLDFTSIICLLLSTIEFVILRITSLKIKEYIILCSFCRVFDNCFSCD